MKTIQLFYIITCEYFLDVHILPKNKLVNHTSKAVLITWTGQDLLYMTGPSQEERCQDPRLKHFQESCYHYFSIENGGYKVTCLILIARAFTNLTVET